MIDTTTDIRSEAEYLIDSRRKKRAERARTIRYWRGIGADVIADGRCTPESARHMLRVMVREVREAPEKPTPANLAREAHDTLAWSASVSERTDWNALWCGQQDALADRLDQAGRHARVCREAARLLATEAGGWY